MFVKTLKAAASVVASLALLAGASSASALTVTPTGPVVATGTLNQALAGGQYATVCNVTLYGAADASGFTFTSYTGTAQSGPLACDDSLVFPIRVNATKTNELTIQRFVVDTRLGECVVEGLKMPFANSVATFNNTVFDHCEVSGNLTISPFTQVLP